MTHTRIRVLNSCIGSYWPSVLLNQSVVVAGVYQAVLWLLECPESIIRDVLFGVLVSYGVCFYLLFSDIQSESLFFLVKRSFLSADGRVCDSTSEFSRPPLWRACACSSLALCAAAVAMRSI